MLTSRVAVALMTVLALAVPVAHAKPPTPDPVVRQKFESGKKAYRLGDYDEAIREWKEAYRLGGDPIFLFNIGQAYRDKGDLEQAVLFLRNYLREGKEVANRDRIEARITEMEGLIAARKAEREKPPTGPADENGQVPVSEPEPRVVTTPIAEPPPRRSRGLLVAGFVTAGAGLALVGSGVFFGMRASAAEDEVARARSQGALWTDELAATDERGRSSARLSTIFLGAGAGVVVTGGVLVVLGLRKSSERPTRAAIVPTRGGAAVVVGGSF